jgi:1-acyl-sn-glycerol-3-phosphate acyltransferase
MLIWFRSTLFIIGVVILLVLFLPLALVLKFFPLMRRHEIISQKWTRAVMLWLRFTCGLDYTVIFKGTLPTTPAVIMCKHQSAWETLALQLIMPLHVWVLKRELLWIPIFGWELSTMGPIAINRQSRAIAQKQLIEQGADRITQGFWIMIFPEGTRIAPGNRGQYKYGGARLASMLDIPLIPIAHNAGEFWPKNSFRKYPGNVTVIVGEAIYPNGRDPKAITQEIENWIENEMLSITGLGPQGPDTTTSL